MPTIARGIPILRLPDWLAQLPSAWLVVPLVSGTELVGFVVLASSRATIEVNWEVRDLLKTASRQAASYLGQIRATDALLEARKFDAFNRMSAFVVHDLKNLVAQLSLMLKNAERHRDNPEFQRDMLATVEHVVGRMNHLMLQLRIGATPLEKPRLTDVEAIVRRVCAAQGGRPAAIDLDLAPGLLALGHEDRLDHVIGHLVQNALDATAGGGKVQVHLDREGAFVVLEVTDSGVGMSAEFIRDRLFKPFETTKASGHGHRSLRKRAVRRRAGRARSCSTVRRTSAPACAFCCRRVTASFRPLGPRRWHERSRAVPGARLRAAVGASASGDSRERGGHHDSRRRAVPRRETARCRWGQRSGESRKRGVL